MTDATKQNLDDDIVRSRIAPFELPRTEPAFLFMSGKSPGLNHDTYAYDVGGAGNSTTGQFYSGLLASILNAWPEQSTSASTAGRLWV
jgi:hypothetical protein